MWNAIDRVVRAFGRIVVCVVAAADVSTMKMSRWLRTEPITELPKIAVPSTDRTSFWWAGFPSPTP